MIFLLQAESDLLNKCQQFTQDVIARTNKQTSKINRIDQIDKHENSALDLQFTSSLPKPNTDKTNLTKISEDLFQNSENNDHSPATFSQNPNNSTGTKRVNFKCRNCSLLHTDLKTAVQHFKICNHTGRVSNSGHIDEKVHPKQQPKTVTSIKCQILTSTEQYVTHLKMHQNGVAKSEDYSKRYFIVAPGGPKKVPILHHNQHSGLKTVPTLHHSQHSEDHVTSFQLDRHSKIQTAERVIEEDGDDRKIRASNPQAATNPEITSWSSARTSQLSHLVTKVKDENPFCDDIDMQTKSNGVSCFDTTMENSTKISEVTDNTQCLVCGETFANIMQYTHHLNVHLGKQESAAIKNECTEQLHECLNCLEKNPKESDLLTHKINCSELYKCAKCGKKCSSENKLKMHMKYIGKSRILDQYQKGSCICRLCKKSFISRSHLTLHINDVHHKLFSKLCDKTFAGKTHHDKLKPFSCTLCYKSFAYNMTLSRHIEAVHKKAFSCTSCNKYFSSKQYLANHIDVIHHNLNRFSCTLCDKSFAENGTLATHIETMHGVETVHNNAFSCTLCHKSFAKKRTLKKHIYAVHHKKKPIPCTLCEKRFVCRAHLNDHIIAEHDKLKPFSCTLCDKSFARKGQLSRHVKIVHENLKPFSCTFCHKSFPWQNELLKHVNAVHKQLKPFSCTLCDRTFATNTQLCSHVDRVHSAVDFYRSLGMSTESETEQDDSNT